MDAITQIIQSNPAIFGLSFKGYQDGKIIYSDPSEFALTDAERDLYLFNERQEAIYKRDKIAAGDWVELKDGSFERITVDQMNERIQVGGSFGGSFYIGKYGGCSYSGGCGEGIFKTELAPTDEYKDGMCWMFHLDYSGAHRGVYHTLKFKVWKQVNK